MGKQEEQLLFQLTSVCYCLDLYGTKENEQLALFACDYQSYVFSTSPTLNYQQEADNTYLPLAQTQ